MVCPALRFAPHNGSFMSAGEWIGRVRKCVGRRIRVQKQGTPSVGMVWPGAVNQTAVMNGDGSGRPRQILGFRCIDAPGVFVADAADPLVPGVVLIEELALVASGDGGERPLLIAYVIEVNAYCERAVVGVRPVGNVLMPFYLLAAFRPFEIQFGVMEFYVRSHQIGCHVGNDGLRRKFPVGGVMFDGVAQPAKTRIVRGVTVLQIEHGIRFAHGTAAPHHFVRDVDQALNPVLGHDAFNEQVPVIKVELTLLLGKPSGSCDSISSGVIE